MTRNAVVVILVFALEGFLMGCSSESDDGHSEVTNYNYLATEGKWEVLAEKARTAFLKTGDEVDANYFHLAQAHRGRLVEELFKIPMNGVSDLILWSPETYTNGPWLAHIFFAAGIVSRAEEFASNNLITREGEYDYSMLNILNQIELMRGNTRVAEKYGKRIPARYLNRDMPAYRDFVAKEEFCANSPVGDLMERVFDCGFEDILSMQYAFSILLLAKDVVRIHNLVEKHFGSPLLNTLPTPVQEALVFYGYYQCNVLQKDASSIMDWLLSHGVTKEILRKFYAFQNTDGLALLGYKDTFWHYSIFTGV